MRHSIVLIGVLFGWLLNCNAGQYKVVITINNNDCLFHNQGLESVFDIDQKLSPTFFFNQISNEAARKYLRVMGASEQNAENAIIGPPQSLSPFILSRISGPSTVYLLHATDENITDKDITFSCPLSELEEHIEKINAHVSTWSLTSLHDSVLKSQSAFLMVKPAIGGGYVVVDFILSELLIFGNNGGSYAINSDSIPLETVLAKIDTTSLNVFHNNIALLSKQPYTKTKIVAVDTAFSHYWVLLEVPKFTQDSKRDISMAYQYCLAVLSPTLELIEIIPIRGSEKLPDGYLISWRNHFNILENGDMLVSVDRHKANNSHNKVLAIFSHKEDFFEFLAFEDRFLMPKPVWKSYGHTFGQYIFIDSLISFTLYDISCNSSIKDCFSLGLSEVINQEYGIFIDKKTGIEIKYNINGVAFYKDYLHFIVWIQSVYYFFVVDANTGQILRNEPFYFETLPSKPQSSYLIDSTKAFFRLENGDVALFLLE